MSKSLGAENIFLQKSFQSLVGICNLKILSQVVFEIFDFKVESRKILTWSKKWCNIWNRYGIQLWIQIVNPFEYQMKIFRVIDFFILKIFNRKNSITQKIFIWYSNGLNIWIQRWISYRFIYYIIISIKLKFFDFRLWNRISRKPLEIKFSNYIFPLNFENSSVEKYFPHRDFCSNLFIGDIHFFEGVRPLAVELTTNYFLKIFNKTFIISGMVVCANIDFEIILAEVLADIKVKGG